MNSEWQDHLDIGPECNERFLSHENVPGLAEQDISIAGVSTLSGRYLVARKAPEFHTILYTRQGSGRIVTPYTNIVTESDTFVVLPKGTPFRYWLDENETVWKTLWLCLEDSDRWQHLQQFSKLPRYCEGTQAIYHLMCQLYYEKRHPMQDYPLLQLKRYLKKSLGDHEQPELEKRTQLRRLESLFSLIEQRLHSNWTIEEMCQHVHVSPPHLHRLCQQRWQRSPMQKVIELRMERAMHLLTDTSWPLTQIANAVGYSDTFNFSHRFKKSIGTSPSQYRKTHMININ